MSTITNTERQFNKMTKTPVGKLIIMLGIPTTISMLITNIYNMADSFFVSKISISAGGATSVVFGIMAILQAFGFMFGHGAGSYISRALGEKHIDKASKYATSGFLGALVSGMLILTFGLIFLEPLMYLLGSTETILPYAKDYGFWILLASPFMTTSCVLNNVLRYEGRANLAMIGLTTGGILNIALDPLFIFTFNMGIAGAGLATAVSQVISFGILFSVFMLGKTQSKISFKHTTKDIKIFVNIIITGLPSLARQGLSSVSTMVLNTQAKPFGDATIAAFGYVSRTSHMIFSVGLGIGQGFQPVAGFNYGAKQYSRVKKGAIFTTWFGSLLIGVLAVIGIVLAPQIISIFRSEKEVVEIGARALRFYCVGLMFMPVAVVATMLFQSIGKNISALILSMLQCGAIFIPMCLILPMVIGVVGIEISHPIAYVVSAFASLPCLVSFLKKLPKDGEMEVKELIEQPQNKEE